MIRCYNGGSLPTGFVHRLSPMANRRDAAAGMPTLSALSTLQRPVRQDKIFACESQCRLTLGIGPSGRGASQNSPPDRTDSRRERPDTASGPIVPGDKGSPEMSLALEPLSRRSVCAHLVRAGRADTLVYSLRQRLSHLVPDCNQRGPPLVTYRRQGWITPRSRYRSSRPRRVPSLVTVQTLGLDAACSHSENQLGRQGSATFSLCSVVSPAHRGTHLDMLGPLPLSTDRYDKLRPIQSPPRSDAVS